ncbi:MAG: response regulator [Deltaproteobacteria bacterium]|nr:response regulator [Deltaproteobacteria bacterium]
MALKILAVDDSKTIRMIVKKAFKAYDCKVLEAADGKEGLETASREKPDLIVLDITMPVMSGPEMLTELKKDPALKEIPVIMLTAESGKENVVQILKMGVKDYIVKPFKGAQLIERVTKVVTLESKQKEDEDTSKKYFSTVEDVQILALPQKLDRPVSVDIERHFKSKVEEMVSSGIKKFILDMSKVGGTNVTLIKLIIMVIQTCRQASIGIRIVGTAALSEELKGFAETSEITVDLSIEDAKGAL